MPPAKGADRPTKKKGAPSSASSVAKKGKKEGGAAAATKSYTTERAQVISAWVKKPAIILTTDNKIYVAASASKPQGKPWCIKVINPIDAEDKLTVEVDELTAGTITEFKQIMQHFVGGEFHSAEGSVTVTGITDSGSGNAVVEFTTVSDADSPLAEADPMTIDEFLSKFTQGQPQQAREVDDSPFDFAPYPRLVRVLRIVKAFGADADATDMSKTQAAELMMGMKTTNSITQQNGTASLDLDKTAELLDAEYQSEKASPELTALSRMAITGALDEATFGAKGKAARELTLHASVATPKVRADRAPSISQEGEGSHAKTAPGAPKKRVRIAEAKDDDRGLGLESDQSESDDSSETSGDDWEIPINGRAAKAAKALPSAPQGSKAAGKKTAPPPGADEADEPSSLSSPSVLVGEMLLLGEICPPDIPIIDAARTMFSDSAVRKLANCEPVPDSISPRDLPRMTKRYALAFNRLVAKIGTAWRSRPTKPARNQRMLEDWAEAVLDIVAQDHTAQHAFNRASPHTGTSYGFRSPIPQAEAEQALTAKPAEGLTGAKQAGAISPDVCERLWERRAEHEQAIVRATHKRLPEKPSAADVIGETPETIRLDIQKAQTCNGLSDGPGETSQYRRSLPPFAHGQRRKTSREVEAALKAVTLADTTGQVSLDVDAVATIAASTLEGSVTFADFTKLANTALGSGAAQKGSAAANIEAWSFFLPAMTTVLRGIGAPQKEIAALNKIGNVVTSPPGIARLSPYDVADWIERILRSWKASVRDFRLHEGSFPSLHQAIEDHHDNFTFKSLKSSIQGQGSSAAHASQPATKSLGQKQQTAGVKHSSGHGSNTPDPKRQKVKHTRSGPPTTNQGLGGPPNQGTGNQSGPSRPSKSLWPERTHKISDAKFLEIRDAAKAKWPDTCVYCLIAKCGKDPCPLKHDRPADFEAFLGTHRLKLNGEVSASATCSPLKQAQHLPSP